MNKLNEMPKKSKSTQQKCCQTLYKQDSRFGIDEIIKRLVDEWASIGKPVMICGDVPHGKSYLFAGSMCTDFFNTKEEIENAAKNMWERGYNISLCPLDCPTHSGVTESIVNKKNETFSIPLGIKKQKSKIDEMLSKHPDLNKLHVLSYFSSVNEQEGNKIAKSLSEGKLDEVAQQITEHAIRLAVRYRLDEYLKKKPNGGYTLYSPKSKKGGEARKVGEFADAASAYRALLARFPPKDPEAKKRLQAKIRAAQHKNKPKRKYHKHNESLEKLRIVIGKLVTEALFKEEEGVSQWEANLERISRQILAKDPKFSKLQKTIEKKTEEVLKKAFNDIKKAVNKVAKVEEHGIKKNEDMGKLYCSFSAQIGNITVEPIFIYTDRGIPKLELSQEAEMMLTKAEPDQADLFRGRLGSVQEKVFSKVNDLKDATQKRDKYLDSIKDAMDGYVSDLSPLEVSILKGLLSQKYRKL